MKNIISFFIFIFIIFKNKKVNSNENPLVATSTITLASISETQNITFLNGNLLIWPENCKLNVKNGEKESYNDRDYISISNPNSNEINVLISVNERDSGLEGECRYHLVNYIPSNSIYRTDTGIFKFNNYTNLNLFFKIENETNPIYYLYLNKLGTGNLIFDLQSGNDFQNFTISDSDPNRILVFNKMNLFKTCANGEPYNCSINFKITGNAEFNILIRNGSNNTLATYLKPNEMILGVAQSSKPLFFFTEISNGISGEIFINYKKGGTIVYSKIVDKGSKGIINEINEIDLGNFDYYNKKLNFNSSSCGNENGCELFIGIFVYDYQFDDFSIFLKNNNSSVKILPNEFVFGTLTSVNENVSYNIPISTSELNFIFENDNCKLSISKK